ncbi:MAG: amidohydrolase family protein [Nitriliruptorales bacterium]|nr:amidohydrolase family protein [Nitriliruptorales bacterium]
MAPGDALSCWSVTIAPGTDAEVPGFWHGLGLPGLVDVHVHFMPPQVLTKVWAHFDRLRHSDGRPFWPIAYREDQATRVQRLADMGVRAFSSLIYPHKPGMAQWLNGWAAHFAAANPRCLRSATFFPEPEADRYVAEEIDAGARIFKVHLRVGAYDPRDPLLSPVWRRLEAAGVPVVVHAGSGPQAGEFTGPGPIGEVLETYPDLALVIAHMGMPEYAAFWEVALRYPNVRLDTTLTFTDFAEHALPGAYPPKLLESLATHPDRVLLGSDFPNIPHPYAHQLAALARLGLGEPWLRAVCHDNAARLFDLGRLD